MVVFMSADMNGHVEGESQRYFHALGSLYVDVRPQSETQTSSNSLYLLTYLGNRLYA